MSELTKTKTFVDAAVEKAVIEFTQSILHGNDAHKDWLMDAAYRYLDGQPVPETRGM